ncbi:MAG: glycoside hydrolase family 57 protein [Rhodocyclaceae bacterium]|nr:glycoside hydrolase family 57 protein [Rhodocyclaceae bacterium]
MPAPHLDLVFLWHMHQPDYRDRTSGEFALPWVLLHALKDYADMADHLERHPKVRAVVNFVPVLLDQIDDYCAQIDAGSYRDPLLRLLAQPDLDRIDLDDRRLLLDTCFRSNHTTMLAPFPHYLRLHKLLTQFAKEGEAALAYLSGTYYADLVTWYFLAWSGETERRRQPLLADLMTKGQRYTLDDRRQLLAWIGATLKGIVPRYRALQDRGQIELSATPHTHPLGPLLLDFAAALESQPDAPLPQAASYPGGRSRLDAHIENAKSSHARRFGAAPTGMWPAEGAVSAPLAALFAQHGCRWLASGEGVLRNSLHTAQLPAERAAYRPWQVGGADGLTLFFRDERLSDLLGFEYAKWHGRDAARHFVGQLELILSQAPAGETPIVGVVLDGENAWEHYPYNAYYFFDDLYALLEDHPAIRTTTYGEIVSRAVPPPRGTLPRLTAGSWVYGTLSTWIGDADKNRAWDLLCEAKHSYDLVVGSGRLSPDEAHAAEAQLAVCESSDWFWWFGDYNPAPAVASFDRLYRHNLANLYRLLKLTPPRELDLPISAGSAAATQDGTMRRAT